MRGDAPSARCRRTLDLDPTTKTLLRFFGEHLHGLFRDRYAFAACERGVGLVDHRHEFETPALALFPKRQRLLDGLFLAGEASALDGLLNEGLLIGSQLDLQRFTSSTKPRAAAGPLRVSTI